MDDLGSYLEEVHCKKITLHSSSIYEMFPSYGQDFLYSLPIDGIHPLYRQGVQCTTCIAWKNHGFSRSFFTV